MTVVALLRRYGWRFAPKRTPLGGIPRRVADTPLAYYGMRTVDVEPTVALDSVRAFFTESAVLTRILDRYKRPFTHFNSLHLWRLLLLVAPRRVSGLG